MEYCVKKTLLIILNVFLTLVLLQGCTNEVNDFTVSSLPSKMTIRCGESRVLYNFEDGDIVVGGSLNSIVVSSSDDNVVSYINNILYANHLGDAVVTVKDKKGKVVKEIDVTVTYTNRITMTCGEEVDLKDVIDVPSDVNFFNYFKSSDDNVAYPSNSIVLAWRPGVAVVQSEGLQSQMHQARAVEVTVVPTMEKIFNEPPLVKSMVEFKEALGDKNITSETQDNTEYRINESITYSPYGDCESITYTRNADLRGGIHSDITILIKTGKPGLDVFSFLLSNYDVAKNYHLSVYTTFTPENQRDWIISSDKNNKITDYTDVKFSLSYFSFD